MIANKKAYPYKVSTAAPTLLDPHMHMTCLHLQGSRCSKAKSNEDSRYEDGKDGKQWYPSICISYLIVTTADLFAIANMCGIRFGTKNW